MSIDDDLSDLAAHRIEVESWLEVARRQEQDDEDQLRRDYLDRKACESIEAEEQKWRGIFAAQPRWMRNVTYRSRPGIDSRLFGGEAS